MAEAIGTASAIVGLAGAAKKLYESLQLVSDNEAMYHQTVKRILKTSELLEELSNDCRDREAASKLQQSLLQFTADLECLCGQLGKAFKVRKGVRGAFKTRVNKWRRADKVKAKLLQVGDEIEECYSHLLMATTARTEIQVVEMIATTARTEIGMVEMIATTVRTEIGMAEIQAVLQVVNEGLGRIQSKASESSM